MKAPTITDPQNYQSSIIVSASAEEAFDKIGRVSGCWATNVE
jgi:hypothetical protein